MKTITTGFLADTVNGIKINTSIKCNSANYKACNSREVSFVVLHYTGNVKDSAVNNAKYFRDVATGQASAHYFVDDNNIYQSVGLKDKAYHCGTNGTYYHKTARNANSIGIEQCTSGNYTISTKTIYNASYLCAYLCKMLGITSDTVDTYVIRHYDVTHKICPKQFVEKEAEWIAFKNAVKLILEGKDSSVDDLAPSVTIAITKETSITVLLNNIPSVVMQKGSTGNSVAWLQQSLNKIGGYSLSVDGDFGNLTLAAVKDFQRKYGLDVDGSVGKFTRTKIIELLNTLKLQESGNNTTGTTDTTSGTTVISDPEQYIWAFLSKKLNNEYGVAGLMGNIQAESGCRSNNLQNTFEKKLGYTDDGYVKAVDSGKYTNFVYDKAGFGLCQWTYWTRKKKLIDYANFKGVSIADLQMQLEFLIKELETNYPKLLTTLKNAKSVKAASDAVLTQFEQPADQSLAVKNTRAKYGQNFYNTYTKKSTTASRGVTTAATTKQYFVYSNKYFSSKKAQEEYELIKKLGYSVRLVRSGIVYRVQVGGDNLSSTAANQIKTALLKAGHQCVIETK